MVRGKDIETVIATMARIPPRRVAADDRETARTSKSELKAQDLRPGRGGRAGRTGDQDEPRRAWALPERPIGCFLFAGPTGVGKTELAKQLAEILGVEFMRFDMSRVHGARTRCRA